MHIPRLVAVLDIMVGRLKSLEETREPKPKNLGHKRSSHRPRPITDPTADPITDPTADANVDPITDPIIDYITTRLPTLNLLPKVLFNVSRGAIGLLQ